MAISDLDYRYSRNNSVPFWWRVNAVGGDRGDALYALGVELQNLEEVMLRRLDDAEQHEVCATCLHRAHPDQHCYYCCDQRHGQSEASECHGEHRTTND